MEGSPSPRDGARGGAPIKRTPINNDSFRETNQSYSMKQLCTTTVCTLTDRVHDKIATQWYNHTIDGFAPKIANRIFAKMTSCHIFDTISGFDDEIEGCIDSNCNIANNSWQKIFVCLIRGCRRVHQVSVLSVESQSDRGNKELFATDAGI